MDVVTAIVTAMIDRGGIFGVISALLFFWNVYRERLIEAEKAKSKEDAKEESDTQSKIKKELDERADELRKITIGLQEENKRFLKDISDLEKEKLEIEKNRTKDLKELLSDYHITASDTLQALKKFEFFITNSREGKQ